MKPPLFLVCAALLSCKTAEPEPEMITGIDNRPGGNPLAPYIAGFPFPSDAWLVDDPTTATGRRLEIPPEAIPSAIDPAIFAGDDGFSRIPPILTLFEAGVDPSSLPVDIAASIEDDSTVWLIEAETHARIPVIVEMDVNGGAPAEQSLIIRPSRALEPNTGYVVMLRDGILHADGAPIIANDAFRALRDGIATDSPAVEEQRDDFVLVNAEIAAVGIPAESVVLAWSFHTRSREQVTAPLLHMHDVMNSYTLAPPTLQAQEADIADDLTLVRGSFMVPNFLDDALELELDAQGLPIANGEVEVEFLVTIPNTLGSAPRPVIAYGHGFFSNKEEASRSLANSLHEWQMSAVSIDFDGFNSDEELDTLGRMSGDLAQMDTVVNQQLMAQAKFTAVARLIEEQLGSLEVDLGNGPVQPLDASTIHYAGISNGGTQGVTILAASPRFSRGAVVVPGGGWSHMLQRATQWTSMNGLFSQFYSQDDQIQLGLALVQNRFDPADGMNYADRMGAERFEGRPPLQVSLHEAVNDSQVNNMVTHMVARTMQVSLVTPSPLDIYGLDTLDAPAPNGVQGVSALFVYDEQVEPYPGGPVPPAVDNDTHGTVRELPAYLEQMGRFLEDGTVVQVCDGACDPD